MRTSPIIAILLGLLLGVAPTESAMAARTSTIDVCKISQVDLTSPMRVGWPKYPGLMAPVGKPKFLVVGIDFSDAPAENLSPSLLETNLKLGAVIERYRYVSDAQFVPSFDIYPEWVRMPELSQHYGQNKNRVEIVADEWSTHHITHDVTIALQQKGALLGYGAIIVYVSGGQSLSGLAAYSTVLDQELVTKSNAVSNYIVLGREWETKKDVELWRVIVHEINHLLGLADLYLYDPDGYWKGKTPGPFGQQAYVYNSSSDSLGWNRWLNGWIPENHISCFSRLQKVSDIYIGPDKVAQKNEKQLVLFKLSESKILVLEGLHARGFASTTYKNSVLVYTVDSSVKIGEGPINLIPRPTKLTLAPLSPNLPDWERFKDAPLIPRSFVKFEDYVILNQSKKGSGALVSIFKASDKAMLKKYSLDIKKSYPTKRTITCKKSGKIVKITSAQPKCPSGYLKIK